MAHDGHDDWFHGDHPSGQMESHGDFNPYGVMGFLAVTIIITFLIIAVFVGWFARTTAARKAVMQEQRTPTQEYDEAMASWNESLYGPPRWLNAQENQITVPVDIATQQVVTRYLVVER